MTEIAVMKAVPCDSYESLNFQRTNRTNSVNVSHDAPLPAALNIMVV